MKNLSDLTLADLKAMKPRPEVLAFAKSCDGDIQKFWDMCPNGEWLLWLLNKTGTLPELSARAIALAYARKVLPIYEKTIPVDDGPRRCLKAVEIFLKCPTVANQRSMINAATEVRGVCTAYVAAVAAYHAAHDSHPMLAAYHAVSFAAVAADFSTPEHSFNSAASFAARKRFEQWGANKVRSIIKLSDQKSKTSKTPCRRRIWKGL